MIAHAGLLLAIVSLGSVAIAAASLIACFRWRAQARGDRLALRLAMERERTFVDSARRLADAARTSIVAVREEMDRAVRTIAPGIDAVMFFEEQDAQLVCVAATGARVHYFAGIRCALDDESSLLVRALHSGHRVTTHDAPDVRALHPGDVFAAAIPLVLDSGRRCVLYIGSANPDFAAVVDRIVSLVDGTTPAYRIAFERADDRARAEYDGLTGLLTARALRTALARITERARTEPIGRLGLLFIDTDRFKAWNDTYGHASGDALLRELAELLRRAASRDGDVAARNGGDEFCLIFTDCEKSTAVERAERLRASIADANFIALAPADVTAEPVIISASIGVAAFPVDAATPRELLEKADAAMYHSKRTGRDGVSFYSVDGALVRADPGRPVRGIADRRDG